VHELAEKFGFEENMVRKAFTLILRGNMIDGFITHNGRYFLTRTRLRDKLEEAIS
jgi:hypothetical protein